MQFHGKTNQRTVGRLTLRIGILPHPSDKSRRVRHYRKSVAVKVNSTCSNCRKKLEAVLLDRQQRRGYKKAIRRTTMQAGNAVTRSNARAESPCVADFFSLRSKEQYSSDFFTTDFFKVGFPPCDHLAVAVSFPFFSSLTLTKIPNFQ